MSWIVRQRWGWFVTRDKLYAALLIIAIGLGGTLESAQYDFGTLTRMGPGFYPFALSILLIILGFLVLIVPDPSRTGEKSGVTLTAYIRPWICVLGGAALFLIVGTRGGLIPATFILIFVSALGDSKNSIRASALLGAGAVVFTVIVFHFGMQIQFPLWRWG